MSAGVGVKFEIKWRDSLAVQWFRLHNPGQGVWVRSLVRELRSHMRLGMAKKERRVVEERLSEEGPRAETQGQGPWAEGPRDKFPEAGRAGPPGLHCEWGPGHFGAQVCRRSPWLSC